MYLDACRWGVILRTVVSYRIIRRIAVTGRIPNDTLRRIAVTGRIPNDMGYHSAGGAALHTLDPVSLGFEQNRVS